MQVPQLSHEIRWFLEGHIDPGAKEWFEALPGDPGLVELAYPRKDVYLVVSARDDLGLKVRDGRFEIKTRERKGREGTFVEGRIAGVVEVWRKQTWDYKESIGEIINPFTTGPRVRMVKSRTQRKYVQGEPLEPVEVNPPPDKPPQPAVAVELTELYSQAAAGEDAESLVFRHWTIGMEALAEKPRDLKRLFEAGLAGLLESYDGVELRRQDSYGYPQFALSIAAKL